MKTFLTFLLCLLIAPSITLAQVSEVDPQGTSSCVSLTNNLRYRTTDAQTGGDVSVLQDFLQASGYLKASPSGYMGLLTVKGVKSFQSDNGISPTGYVGPLTRAKIQTASCASTSGVSAVNNSNNSTTNNTISNTAGCASGAIFSSTTGVRCSNASSNDISTTVSYKNVPHIDMVKSPATHDFQVDSGAKAWITGKFLTSSPTGTLRVYINNIQATVIQSDQTTVVATMPTLSPGTYSLYLVNDEGTSNSLQVTVIGSTATSQGSTLPNVTLLANGQKNLTINNTQGVDFTYSSTNADYCTRSGGMSNWANTSHLATSGTVELRDAVSNGTFNITCYNSAGASISDSVTVNVISTSGTTVISADTSTSNNANFHINNLESAATGALATVGIQYSGAIGFYTIPDVMSIVSSNRASFNLQGLPPGLVADPYITRIANSNYGFVSFKGIPTQAGNFPITVTFTDNSTFNVTKTLNLNVSPSSTFNSQVGVCTPSTNSSTPVGTTNSVGSITVNSPNGGDCLTKGSSQIITWSNSSNIDKVLIRVLTSDGIGGEVSNGLVSNTGSYTWNNISVPSTSDKKYKIQITGYQTGLGSVTDKSDDYFIVN